MFGDVMTLLVALVPHVFTSTNVTRTTLAHLGTHHRLSNDTKITKRDTMVWDLKMTNKTNKSPSLINRL